MLSHVTGFRPSRDTASLSLRGLPFLGPQSGAHQLSATATVRSATFLFSFRSSDDQLLRLSFVDLVPRLGLNSIHSTTLRSSPARRSSLSASTGDREHATPLSCVQRLLSSLAALLWHCSLSWAGAGVGGWAPKIFAQAFCGERRSRRMPDRGHASHVATGSARFAGFRPPAGTAFSLLFCGLPFLRPQSGARQLVRLLLFGSATFLLPCSGHPTTCCSDCSLSALVFRLGSNSDLLTSLLGAFFRISTKRHQMYSFRIV